LWTYYVCYNALEDAAKSFQHWKQIESFFTAIVGFLSDRGLRGRFIELLVRDACAKLLLRQWSIHHGFNWKWEYMVKFLSALVPIWDVLKTNFKLESFKSADGGWNTVNAAIISEFQKALDFRSMTSIVLGMQAICLGLQRLASWFEGCWDHQYLLEAGPGRPDTGRLRHSEWARASHKCFWKGRRLVEIVSGSLVPLLAKLRASSTQALRDHLANASELERAACVSFMSPILEKLAGTIVAKCEYMFHIPLLFLGALSHKYARCLVTLNGDPFTKLC
jgi:hypothetical protein